LTVFHYEHLPQIVTRQTMPVAALALGL